MFREDVALAKEKFVEALKDCEKAEDPFGDATQMFGDLLEAALTKYGSRGLINQEQLAKTDFTSKPEQLVQTVRDGMADRGDEVKLIGELAAVWMERL